MRLTILRMLLFTPQDITDLRKIWPGYKGESPHINDNQRIYAARFNGRLLAAVRVTLNNKKGMLDSLCVRDVTRRRGVGRYLLEEMISDNPQVQIWWMSSAGITERTTMAAFMQSLGFTLQADGWQKRMNAFCCTQGIAPPE